MFEAASRGSEPWLSASRYAERATASAAISTSIATARPTQARNRPRRRERREEDRAGQARQSEQRQHDRDPLQQPHGALGARRAPSDWKSCTCPSTVGGIALAIR